MTDTSITAVVNPEDFGTGVPADSEDFISAGYDMLPVGNTGAILNGVGFSVTYSTPEFELGSGVVEVPTTGTAVQSGDQTTYDTTIPGEQYQTIIIPNAVTGLALDANAVNEVWVAHDPTAQDSAYIRHGSGLSEPSDPSIKIGEVDTNTDTKSEQWGLLAADGTLSYPSASVAASALSTFAGGVTVYDRETDTLISDADISATTIDASHDLIVPATQTVSVGVDQGRVVAGPYTVNGTLDVNGEFATADDPIDGTGTITGTGTVKST